MKRIFATFLVLTLFTCTFAMPVSAKNTTTKNNDVEIVIHDEVSEETKAKIERFFADGTPAEDNISVYGLTCTLFGHDLKNTMVTTITHNVRTTSPKCLQRTYAYEECTRCDYETSELVKSSYIVCCS